jgi:hypothetical protein
LWYHPQSWQQQHHQQQHHQQQQQQYATVLQLHKHAVASLEPQYSSPTLLTQPQGFLLPFYHGNYWVGLRAIGWPTFGWVDPNVPNPGGDQYVHWGAAGSGSEPDNLLPQENCGAANYTISYDGVWGWADTRCSNSFVSICRVMRELLAAKASLYSCCGDACGNLVMECDAAVRPVCAHTLHAPVTHPMGCTRIHTSA